MKIETEVIMDKYKDNLFSVAFNICRNAADADDVVQDTLIQYHTTEKQFDSEQHIRAWLLRVAINKAKNINMSFFRRASVPIEDYIETLVFETSEEKDLLEAVLRLPEKYRIAMLSSLISDGENRCCDLRRIVQNAESDLENEENILRNLRDQYDELISWAKLYDNASHEAKKMIVNSLIKRVDVYEGYKLKVEFNFDLSQFFYGLDFSA